MNRASNMVAVLCLCCALLNGCGSKDPDLKAAKSDAALTDSVRDYQTAVRETTANLGALEPATINLATLLAEVPESIVPGFDVGNDRFMVWLLNRTEGCLVEHQWLVDDVTEVACPTSGSYGRQVNFRYEEFMISGVRVSLKPGHCNSEGCLPFLLFCLNGDQATKVSAWQGQKVGLKGRIINFAWKDRSTLILIFEDYKKLFGF